MSGPENIARVVMLAGKCGHHYKDDCTSCANANDCTNFEIRRLHAREAQLVEALQWIRERAIKLRKGTDDWF